MPEEVIALLIASLEAQRETAVLLGLPFLAYLLDIARMEAGSLIETDIDFQI